MLYPAGRVDFYKGLYVDKPLALTPPHINCLYFPLFSFPKQLPTLARTPLLTRRSLDTSALFSPPLVDFSVLGVQSPPRTSLLIPELINKFWNLIPFLIFLPCAFKLLCNKMGAAVPEDADIFLPNTFNISHLVLFTLSYWWSLSRWTHTLVIFARGSNGFYMCLEYS